MARRFEFFSGDDAEVIAQWVAHSIPGCERGFGKCVAAGVFRDGQIIGGTVFHNYQPEAGVIEMSSAGKDWLNRPYLFAIHNYIFNIAGCQLAVMRISENNARMLRIAGAYGYEKHLIPRLRGRNEAEVIATLTEESWRNSRFHKRQFHGQVETSCAA